MKIFIRVILAVCICLALTAVSVQEVAWAGSPCHLSCGNRVALDIANRPPLVGLIKWSG